MRGKIIILYVCAAAVLCVRPVYALDKIVTSTQDFATGSAARVESISKEGELKLQGDGTWNTRVYRSPLLTLLNGSVATSVQVDGTSSAYLLPGRDTMFLKYSTTDNKWIKMAPAPTTAFTGAAMVAVNETIYAAFGGYQRTWAKYDVRQNRWTLLENLPDLPQAGMAMDTDGTYIYVLRGAGNSEFWRYDIAANSWSIRSSPPATINQGGALRYYNGNLYVLRGSGTNTMYRYNIAANTWYTTSASSGNPA